MTDIISDVLSRHIQSRPDVIQFAKDRKFEEAWVLHRTESPPSAHARDEYLAREPFTVLIVEYIWNSSDDANRFVLTVFFDRACSVRSPRRCMDIALDHGYSYTDFPSFIQSFDEDIIGHPCLFRDPVEAVNMGIFNHWMSVGPVDLWQKGEP